MINARVETAATKPSFHNAFKKRRCLILADGFYEWKGSKGSKVPMFITLPDHSPFAFAGLWETWGQEEPFTGPARYLPGMPVSLSCRSTIGMPVILKAEAYEPWLDPGNHDPDRFRESSTPWSTMSLSAIPSPRQLMP